MSANWRKHKQKLHALIENEFGASLMNNTKWMEVIQLLKGLGLNCRVKLITSPEITDWRSARSPAPPAYIETSRGPVLALEIEWMEIDPTQRIRRGALVSEEIDRRKALESELRGLDAPHAWVDGVVRVTAHVRQSDASPSPSGGMNAEEASPHRR
jgi:hypothetical protein